MQTTSIPSLQPVRHPGYHIRFDEFYLVRNSREVTLFARKQIVITLTKQPCEMSLVQIFER